MSDLIEVSIKKDVNRIEIFLRYKKANLGIVYKKNVFNKIEHWIVDNVFHRVFTDKLTLFDSGEVVYDRRDKVEDNIEVKNCIYEVTIEINMKIRM